MQIKPISLTKSTILTALIIMGSVELAGAANIVPEAKGTHVAAHRAVYDLVLKDSINSANIADATGRMVFEVSGSKCEGYLVNMRFILSISDTKGSVNVTDVRTSSWEGGKAERFRFNTSQFFNQKLSKTTIGDAARKNQGDGIDVNVKSPKRIITKFDERTYFPTEHTKLMLNAAINGEKVVNAPIYDGSENGNTLYDTTAIIGKELKSDATVVGTKIENLSILKDMVSWPIAISFFDKKKSKKEDHLPDYEISFRLYSNGVSRNLLIDYGDFSLTGKMAHIEFLPENTCN